MYGWKGTTGLILLWQITASICFYTIYAVTPFIRETYHVSAVGVGVMLTTLMLGYTVFLIPAGAGIDRFGEGRVLVVGLIGLAIGTTAVALSWSFITLLMAVFFLGICYATAIPGTNKAVFNAIRLERQNTSMGIKQVGVTAGSGISAVMIPLFGATRFGWEAGFFIAASTAILVTVFFFIKYSASGNLMDGSRRVGALQHFKNRTFTMLTIAGFFLGAALFTTIGYTILYVHESIGATVVFAGIVLATAQIFGSLGRIISGWLADRVSMSPNLATIRILAAQSICATVLFFVVTKINSQLLALVFFALLGFFILGFTGIYYSCMGTIVPVEQMGSATAGGQIALNAGALIAPPVFGLIVDLSGYAAAWLLLVGAGLLSSIFLLRIEWTFRVQARQS